MKELKHILHGILMLLPLAAGYWIISSIAITESRISANPSIVSNAQPIDGWDEPSQQVSNGKMLFNSHCASCHNLYKKQTGPALIGFADRGPWKNKAELLKWVRNPKGYAKTNAYTRNLIKEYGLTMQAFPDISEEELDQIAEYIDVEGSYSPY